VGPTWKRGLAQPARALGVSIALAKGMWYRISCRMRGRRFVAGRNFRVFGSLDVRGPGQVVFGDNVVLLDLASLWTYSAKARIVVGDNVMMGRTRFACAEEIVIGRDCIIGEVTFTDTDFHSTRADRSSREAPVRVVPIHVGENVWLAQHAALLPGTRIGRNSVVGYGAVCMRDFPENVIILGNPAKVAAPIASTEGQSVAGNVPNLPASRVSDAQRRGDGRL